MSAKWYDVQDEEGTWRIGYCLSEDSEGFKLISLDGFHPNYNTFYCKHSSKVAQVRKKTRGLTVPNDSKVLRQVITNSEIENISGRLNLILNYPNFLELDPKLIRTSIRTDFLVIVDKIMCTPFQIIRQTKLLELSINKLFLNMLTLFIKFIQFSKVYLPLLQSNEVGKEVFNSLYEMTTIANLILGNHIHSATFYDHKFNINLKTNGYLDYFVHDCLLPFRTFFKKIKTVPNLNISHLQVTKEIIDLFLYICDKGKKPIMEGENQPKASLVLDQIINHIKYMGESSKQLLQILQADISLIGRIETVFALLKGKKICPLRNYLLKKSQQKEKVIEKVEVKMEKENEKEKVKEKEKQKGDKQYSEQKQQSERKVLQLEERITKLQLLISNQEKKENKIDKDEMEAFKTKQNIPMENLGEEMFLSSLEWALETGELETARKLTKWRRSLLQIGRITGWEVALAIGCKTFKKGEISPTDIIEANYEYMMKQNF